MSDERGYAVIEAFLVGLVLLVPVIWVLVAASTLHRTALASASAVREAGLVASRADRAYEADEWARSAIARALSERGVDPTRSKVVLDTQRSSGRDGLVRVDLAVPVPVIAIPFAGRSLGPEIWVKARHVAQVEPYRSLGD